MDLIKDFEDFCLAVFPEQITNEIPAFHRVIYSHIITKQRVAIAAPRGFAKSKIVSVFYPTYSACYQLRKDIVIISASESLAIELLRQIKRELENNQVLISMFGDLRSDKWTENHIILKNGVNIRAKGAGGQIRGFRPDCLILDDIETDESVASEEQRKKLKDWIFRACLNTLLPEGQFLIIGTILHPLSILSDLLDTPNGWVKERFKAYIDGIEEKGHELWGVARPHEWLQQRKAEIGSFAFASEFMNDPKADTSAPIRAEHIRYWTDLPTQYSGVIAVDPAYSEDDKADYKVASLVLIDQTQSRYLSKYIRTHAPTGEFINMILDMFSQNKGVITALGIPNSGVEKLFFETFNKICEDRRIYPPVVELANSFITSSGQKIANKKARIVASLQPLFENGKYYIHKDQYEVKEELLTIGSSRWDDIVDTLCYAEQILQPFHEQEIKEIGRYGDEIPIQTNRGFNYGY